jgi:signal transduction histidine kinase
VFGSGSERQARRRRTPGLRVKLTLLSAGLACAASAIMTWLGWTLLNGVVQTMPQLPSGTPVTYRGYTVDAGQLRSVLTHYAHDVFLGVGLISCALVVCAAIVLGWALSGRLLQPLREVTGTAQRLSAESLGERIEISGPNDEVAELGHTFNDMLGRLQTSFASQQRFVANASHELRTPLSVIRTELDVTLSDPDADADELRRMAEVIRGATMRAGDLVESLLLLAKTEGSGLAVRQEVELSTAVRSALSAVRPELAGKEIVVTTELSTAVVFGDPALLERVAGNLVENAIRHNVVGGWLRVSLIAKGKHALLDVSSSGELIAPEQVQALFEPFRRGGVARTKRNGAGLGLSIVQAVVAAHRGTVSASAVEGGGLTVHVAIPLFEGQS